MIIGGGHLNPVHYVEDPILIETEAAKEEINEMRDSGEFAEAKTVLISDYLNTYDSDPQSSIARVLKFILRPEIDDRYEDSERLSDWETNLFTSLKILMGDVDDHSANDYIDTVE